MLIRQKKNNLNFVIITEIHWVVRNLRVISVYVCEEMLLLHLDDSRREVEFHRNYLLLHTSKACQTFKLSFYIYI